MSVREISCDQLINTDIFEIISTPQVSHHLKETTGEIKIWIKPTTAEDHSFRVGAALGLLEEGEKLEKIMLRGGWQTE